MLKGNAYTLTAAILGAAKLILESFGVSVITNQEIDAIANGVGAAAVIAGIAINHFKGKGGETNGTTTTEGNGTTQGA